MNLIERLELVLDESRKNDDLALNLLVKAGVDKAIAPEVLKALGAITVDGGDNSKRVVDLSKNGKDIIPLAVWMGSAWDANDTLDLNINKVADQVHRKGAMPALENVDFTTIMTNNGGEEGKLDTLDKLTQWLDKQGAKTKNVSKGGNGYNFPKEMLAYSDDMVDCYRANTPTEAMMLGSGYPFCISRRDGSNFFYSYRMNPTTTTVYFCWFKDENGNKSHDDMVVVHVGDDGKYMVTLAKNGSFPRDSKATTIEKYPRLKGAIESGKLTVIPMSNMEKEVRQVYNPRSVIMMDDIEGRTPEYIELMLSQGVQLTDNVFDYLFNEIDKGNLRTGNNGNSLIKKYIESGIHPLSKHQTQVLKEAGYENEALRAFEVFWRGRVERGDELDDRVFKELLNNVYKGDLTGDTVIDRYLELGNHLLTPYQSECLKDAGYSQVVEKATRAYLLNAVNSGKLLKASEMLSAIEVLDKGDITKRDSIVNQYLSKMVSKARPFLVPLSNFKKGSDSAKIYSIYVLASYLHDHTHTGIFICEKQGDKFVLECIGPLGDGLTFYDFSWIPLGEGDDFNAIVAKGLETVDIIKGADKVRFLFCDFREVERFPYFEGLETLVINGGIFNEYLLKNKELDTLKVVNLTRDMDFSSLTCKHFEITPDRGKDHTVIAPKGVEVFDSQTLGNKKTLASLPRTVSKMFLNCVRSDLEGIPEEITGNFRLKLNNGFAFRELKNFPKKIGGEFELILETNNGIDQIKTIEDIPQCVRDCDVNKVTWNYTQDIPFGLAQFYREKNKAIDIDTYKAYNTIIKKEDGKTVLVYEKYDYYIDNFKTRPYKVIIDTRKSTNAPSYCHITVSYNVPLNVIPDVVEIKEGYGVTLDIYRSFYEELTLDHDISGVTKLSIVDCAFLKEVKGLEHIKGLKSVSVEDCPLLNLESLKSQLPKGIELDLDYAKRESLTTLHTVLNALSEEDAPVGDAGTGSTTGTAVGNGTVSDLGEVPEPKLALLNVPYKKRKKGIKGLIALLSAKSER